MPYLLKTIPNAYTQSFNYILIHQQRPDIQKDTQQYYINTSSKDQDPTAAQYSAFFSTSNL